MICPGCSAANREERRFCKACGTRLKAGCSRCGFENEVDSAYCGGCGVKFAGSANAAAGEAHAVAGQAGNSAASRPQSQPPEPAGSRISAEDMAELLESRKKVSAAPRKDRAGPFGQDDIDALFSG